MISSFGTIGGQPVHTVTIQSTDLRAEIVTHGARLAALWAPDAQGALADIVLGFDSLPDLIANGRYFGATCGRYANRIAAGRLVIDGHVYQLDRNEGDTHLHGGRDGFDTKIWAVAAVTDHAVTLTAQSKDGEMGYPGHCQMTVTYRLDGPNLFIEMTAETDAPTVINMANHAYFNLGGCGSGDVLGHRLRLGADHYTPLGPGNIPTGQIAPVDGTRYDFRALRPIGGQPLDGQDGYDNNWCLRPAAEDLRFAAQVVDPASDRQLRLWTDAPGIQVYTAGHLSDAVIGRFAPLPGWRWKRRPFPTRRTRPGFPIPCCDPATGTDTACGLT